MSPQPREAIWKNSNQLVRSIKEAALSSQQASSFANAHAFAYMSKTCFSDKVSGKSRLPIATTLKRFVSGHKFTCAEKV